MQIAIYSPYFYGTDRTNTMLVRFLSAAAVAVVVSLSLFYLMQRLIGDEGVFVEPPHYDVPKISVMPPRDPPEHFGRKPPKQPPPAEIPPEIPKHSVTGTPGDGFAVPVPRPPTGNNGPVIGLGVMTDGALTTLVAVQPIYPRRALVEGISGYVIVEFSVNKLGTVENAHVVGSDPGTIFDDAALDAIHKFRFRPQVRNGSPIAVTGVQKLFRFEIEGR